MQDKFTGKERDQETGLDFFGARYMSAAQGRFTSVDAPIMDQHPDDPQSWNLYAYGRNNPLVYVDPTGREVELIGDEEERKKALELLRTSVGKVALQLRINERTEGTTTRYFVGIEGDVGEFSKSSSVARDFAGLVAHKSVVEFGITARDLSLDGGAKSYDVGMDGGNKNVRVLVNPSQFDSANRILAPGTILAATRFTGQGVKPPWTINPFTPSISIWHEFGHAWAYMNNANSQAGDVSLVWENRMRALLYGPLGPKNSPRRVH